VTPEETVMVIGRSSASAKPPYVIRGGQSVRIDPQPLEPGPRPAGLQRGARPKAGVTSSTSFLTAEVAEESGPLCVLRDLRGKEGAGGAAMLGAFAPLPRKPAWVPAFAGISGFWGRSRPRCRLNGAGGASEARGGGGG
jgi:hypothetical protein